MKIAIDYDTATKIANVTVDGSKVENVVGVTFNCKYDYENDKMSDKYELRMQSMKKNDDKSVEVYSVMASTDDSFVKVEDSIPVKVDMEVVKAFISQKVSAKK